MRIQMTPKHGQTETVDSVCRRLQMAADTISGLRERAADIVAMCDVVVQCLKNGRKVLTAGNGGSAAEALHMAEELTGRFRGNRVSLPGLCLAADATTLTCIANDFGYDVVFSRQVEGLGVAGDVLVLFTSSGNSPNLIAAAATARVRGLTVIALSGKGGGAMAGKADLELIVPGTLTEHIQEAHQVVMHIILNAVEAAFPPAV
jgi:D-sedoheptulose 7-phosphate isomerase